VALVLRSHGANLLELAWIKRGNFVIVITSESAAAIPQLEPADGSRLLDRPHRGCGPNQAPQSLRQVADRERECWRARRWGWRRWSRASGDAEAPSTTALLPALKSRKPVGKKANGDKGAAGAKGAVCVGVSALDTRLVAVSDGLCVQRRRARSRIHTVNSCVAC